MADLPTGTVTFLFTDIEGSTRLLAELGAQAYAEALAEHRKRLRDAFARQGGVEVDTQGDAFFVAFADARAATGAALAAQDALSRGRILVRMGLHTGQPYLTEEGYVGHDVHLGARIAAAGHGGQVLISRATRDAAGQDLEVLDLGEHRVKDFPAAVSIYQLGNERFPPLKTISNTNLPRPASSFVGREQEVDEITDLLRDGARLLTLTGPGGTGKTRLSIEAATELVPDFKAGVFWVPLASLRDHTLVSDTIARTVGAKDGLAEHVGEREMLLLVDNLEQVVEAAPELATLVEACPNLRLLTTSRELLRVRGEVEYAVPPLAQPEAVELFSTRSGLASDDTIAELCRRLENLPLAVELAAARARVLTPRQILERLAGRLDLLKGGRDAEARQQTLRAAIEWSYDLLSQTEKELFARLAVFAGGATVEAAEQVIDADLDTLQALVDKSLVRHTGDRFWMLETIRDFALERLQASGKVDDLRRRHAEYFLALAEEAEPNMRMYSAEWIQRLEHDNDNLRVALDFFDAIGDSHNVLRLAGSLSDFWIYGGHVEEGWRRLDAALSGASPSPAVRARALAGAADLAQSKGEITNGKALAREAVELQRKLGNRWWTAYSLGQLGFAAIEDGAHDEAKTLLTEAIKLFDELDDESWVIANTRTLAWAYESSGDLAISRKLHEANLDRAQESGDKEVFVGTLGSLSMIAAEQGRTTDSVSLARQNLLAAVDLGSPHALAQALSRVAAICSRLIDKHEAAAQLLGCFDGLREQIGVSESWVARENKMSLDAIAARLDAETIEAAQGRGHAMTLEQGVAFALEQLDGYR